MVHEVLGSQDAKTTLRDPLGAIHLVTGSVDPTGGNNSWDNCPIPVGYSLANDTETGRTSKTNLSSGSINLTWQLLFVAYSLISLLGTFGERRRTRSHQ